MRTHCFRFLILLFLVGVVTTSLGCSGVLRTASNPDPPQPAAMSDQARAAYAYLRYLQLDGEKARQALDRAIELDPVPELYWEKIRTLWNIEAYAQAARTARQGLNRFPGHGELTLALVRSLWAQDKVREATTVLREAIDAHPQNWALRTRLARVLLQEDQPSQALDILKEIPKESRSASAHYFMAQAHTALNNQEQTIHHLQQATEINPSFLKAWAELAYQYELQRDFVAAEKAYTTLLRRGGGNREVILRLIELNLKLNNPDQALRLLEQHQQDANLLLGSIGTFLQNDFPAQAEQAMQYLDSDTLSSPRGLLYRAILAWEHNQDLDRALSLLQQVPPEAELFQRSLALRCRLLMQKEAPKAALALARKGQDMFAEDSDFYALEADILRSQGRIQAARRTLDRGLQQLPENTDLLFQLGVLEYEEDNTQAALEHMNQIITLDPNYAPALNFVGYTLLELNQDLARAKILIEKALELEPDNGYYLDSLAWYQYTVGHHQQAWSTIQTAVSIIGNDPVMWEHYGDIARSLDQVREARHGYQQALKFDPEHPERLQSKIQALSDHTDAPD